MKTHIHHVSQDSLSVSILTAIFQVDLGQPVPDWLLFGVWSSSLTTWPNNEFHLPAMTSQTQGRLVRSTTSVFLTKLCQRIPRIGMIWGLGYWIWAIDCS